MALGPFGLQRPFRTLQDPRRVNRRLHLPLDVIAVALSAVIANAEDRQGVETFGQDRRDKFITFAGTAQRHPLPGALGPPHLVNARAPEQVAAEPEELFDRLESWPPTRTPGK